MKNILSRTFSSLKLQGFFGTYLKIYALISDPWFDKKYGTETQTEIELNYLTINSVNIKNGERYQATKVIFLKKLLNHIKPIIPDSPVLVDLGCGKGRVLLVASEFGFREVRGVEFAHELCVTAKDNIVTYKTRKKTDTVFRVIESDAALYKILKDENVFFIFNSFDDLIMTQVLQNIATSIQENMRKVIIIYHNPKFDNLIKSFDGFMKVGDYNFGYPFAIYSNTLKE
jgi:SAM-dependent methyltransferase